MEFAFTDDQEELRSVVRRFLSERSPEAEVRRIAERGDGFDSALWRTMAAQLGLQGLIVPERFGGQGFGQLELAVVFEEMGRALACSPLFATVALATNALIQVGDEDAREAYLPGIVDGATVATLAVGDAHGRWARETVSVEAEETKDGWVLTGISPMVLDAEASALFLVVARSSRGHGVFAVEAGASGLVRESLDVLDPTRKFGRLRLESVSARPLQGGADVWEAVEEVLNLASVALANEAVGGAQACLDLAVEYAKERVQFGRPIGSFQAVQHLCAEVLVDLESARSGAYYAAWCAAESNDELRSLASMAKSYCSQAYTRAAAVCTQVHGGIGFTWEHPAHLYYKRAKTSELFLGDPALHRERLATSLAL